MKVIAVNIILFVFCSCEYLQNAEHTKRVNELVFYKERLDNTKAMLEQIDTASYKNALQTATIRLLNLEAVLPKTINRKTANYLLNYKKDYFKINTSNEKRKILLEQVNLELIQLNQLLIDVQKELLVDRTEKEMVDREIDAAKSILLAEADFKRGVLIAFKQLQNLDQGIDSTINYYRKESVE
jgi:hypothetical protein